MRNDERNDPNTERLAQRCEERLQRANSELATLRRQPLDGYVLEKVVRTERETERWSRVSAALDRPRTRLLLLEEPGLVLARTLSGLRDDWRGTGLQVVSSCRSLGPFRLDRRACLEALRIVADLLVASLESPRRLTGRAIRDGGTPVFELQAQGDGLHAPGEDVWPARVLVEQAGGTLEVTTRADTVVARVELLPVEASAAPRRPRSYVFPLSSVEDPR